MSTFADDFKEAGRALLEVMGEVVYVGGDGGAGGAERAVQAIVERHPASAVPGGGGQSRKPNPNLTFLNDPVDGIDGATFNPGRVYARVALIAGSATLTKLFLHVEPTEQDDGMLLFEL